MTNIYDDCWAKTNALEVRWDGKFRPCCVFNSRGTNFDTNIDTTTKHFKNFSDDAAKTGCQKCFTQEQIGIDSRRRFLQRYKDRNYLYFYDLQLSNVCNLACTMCSSYYSSKWENLNKKIGLDFVIKPDTVSAKKWSSNNSEHLIEHVNEKSKLGLVCISIKGGEPTMQPEISTFLDTLKYTKNVHLHIITNLQRWPDWFNDLQKYKKVTIGVSIEGVNETYEYSRVYGSWKKFHDNVQRLIKVGADWGFKPLYTAHTIGDSTRLLEYMEKYSPTGLKGLSLNNFAIKPTYVSPTVFPMVIKQAMARVMRLEVHILRDNMIKTKFNQLNYDRFVEYTQKLDKVNGTRFEDTTTGRYFHW